MLRCERGTFNSVSFEVRVIVGKMKEKMTHKIDADWEWACARKEEHGEVGPGNGDLTIKIIGVAVMVVGTLACLWWKTYLLYCCKLC